MSGPTNSENLSPVHHMQRSDFYLPGRMASQRMLSTWPSAWPGRDWEQFALLPARGVRSSLASPGTGSRKPCPFCSYSVSRAVTRQRLTRIISPLVHQWSLRLFLSLCLRLDQIAANLPIIPQSYQAVTLYWGARARYGRSLLCITRIKSYEDGGACSQVRAVLQVKDALLALGI